MNTDLNAPLGQNRKSARSGSRFFKTALRVFAYGLGISVIFGISVYSAFRPVNLHEAFDPTKSVTETAKNDQQSLPQSNTQGGANVDRQVLPDGSVVTKFSPKNRDGNGPLIINASQRQDPRMAGMANSDLEEDTPEGKLPMVGVDGQRPFDFYARPWSGARGTRIAIVVSGLGISQTGTMRAINELPEEVTLAFAANGNSLQRWAPDARRNGHEILLQVPMEPFDYPANDPGPGTLLTDESESQNIASLHKDMARMHSYTGVMNYLGGRFLSDPVALEPVMREIGSRGLMFLDDGTTAQSTSRTLASSVLMPHAFADLTLDGEVSEEAILKKLDDLERIALRKGTAIGVASGFDESIDAIRKWVNEASGRGIEIVGVSALADTPGSN